MKAKVPHVPAAVIFLGLLGCGSGARGPDIEIVDAWARPGAVRMGEEGVPPGSNSAVYLEIRNRGSGADRLLGGETPAAVSVEVHESAMEGDVVRMRRLDGVDLPGGTTVALEPGGLHLMLVDLRQAFTAGDTFPLKLSFRRSPAISLRVPVRGGGRG